MVYESTGQSPEMCNRVMTLQLSPYECFLRLAVAVRDRSVESLHPGCQQCSSQFRHSLQFIQSFTIRNGRRASAFVTAFENALSFIDATVNRNEKTPEIQQVQQESERG